MGVQHPIKICLYNLFTHRHFRPSKHHLQQMQLGIGAKTLHDLIRTVFLQLFVRLPTFFFHFRIRSRGIDILQLHDATVSDVRVAGFV